VIWRARLWRPLSALGGKGHQRRLRRVGQNEVRMPWLRRQADKNLTQCKCIAPLQEMWINRTQTTGYGRGSRERVFSATFLRAGRKVASAALAPRKATPSAQDTAPPQAVS